MYVYVSDFLPLSDCHCKISLKLLSTFKRECTSMNMQKMPKRYKWDELYAFLHPTVQNDIKFFLDKSIEYNKQSINNATNEIHNIFDKVTKLSLHRKSAHRTSTHKKWFDLDLAKIRKHLRERATLLSKFPNNPLLRGPFFQIK